METTTRRRRGAEDALDRPQIIFEDVTDEDVPRLAGLSEVWIWAVSVAALIVVTYRDPDSLTHQTAWVLITVLSVGFMLARGFAKLGTHQFR